MSEQISQYTMYDHGISGIESIKLKLNVGIGYAWQKYNIPHGISLIEQIFYTFLISLQSVWLVV